MKHIVFTGALCMLLFLAGCHRQERAIIPLPEGYLYKDTANRMIQSYLTSLSSVTPSPADSNLRSLAMDATLLRDYLSDTAIKTVKLMLAHTQLYIHSGHEGTPAGYDATALTIILAGFDHSGNYIYKTGAYVPDHCIPCPHLCPAGQAGHNLLE